MLSVLARPPTLSTVKQPPDGNGFCQLRCGPHMEAVGAFLFGVSLNNNILGKEQRDQRLACLFSVLIVSLRRVEAVCT